MTRRIHVLAAATLSLVSLTGCSSDASSPKAEASTPTSSSTSPQAEPEISSLALVARLDCTSFDKNVIASAIGVPVTDLELLTALHAGDATSDGPKATQEVCEFGADKRGMSVFLEPARTMGEQRASIKEALKGVRKKASDAGCDATETTSMGTATLEKSCTISGRVKFADASGLVEGDPYSRVGCQAYVENDPRTTAADLLDLVLETCPDLVRALPTA
jgi:hypothetical protein